MPATKPGDVVVYRAFGNQPRVAKVTESHEDVKNGYPGFSAELLSDSPDYEEMWKDVWGYDHQIVSINTEGGMR